MTNHDYNRPSAGTTDWHRPLNDNFAALDTDVEIRDAEDARGDYDPKDGSKFLATDTGAVYLGDGDQWNYLGDIVPEQTGGGGAANLPGVDIREFGADPTDPSHDDAPAYNEAVQRVAELGGGVIVLPNGDITFDSGLSHDPLVNGDGGNENGVAGFGVTGQGQGLTRVDTTVGFTMNGGGRVEAFENFYLGNLTITMHADQHEEGIHNTVDGFLVENVETDGSGGTTSISGTWRNGIWRDCHHHDVSASYAGIFDVRCENVRFENVRCINGPKAGWWHNYSRRVWHVNCEAAQCGGSGISGEVDPTTGDPCENLYVIGGEYHNNGMRGMMRGDLYVYNAYIHDNDQQGTGYAEAAVKVLANCRIEGGWVEAAYLHGNTPPVVTDVLNLEATPGNTAIHDGWGDTTYGPAFYDGEAGAWRSLVDGSLIQA